MKLRIQGNSIRLRVGPREIQRLMREGALEESTSFGLSAQRFTYSLQIADNESIKAAFENNRLTVRLPRAQLHHWATTDQVGIQATQRVEGEEVLTILVEKDFECLDKAHASACADVFGNPNSTHV